MKIVKIETVDLDAGNRNPKIHSSLNLGVKFMQLSVIETRHIPDLKFASKPTPNNQDGSVSE